MWHGERGVQDSGDCHCLVILRLRELWRSWRTLAESTPTKWTDHSGFRCLGVSVRALCQDRRANDG